MLGRPVACVLLIFSAFLIDCGFGAFLSLQQPSQRGNAISPRDEKKYGALTNSMLMKRSRSEDATSPEILTSIPFLDMLLASETAAKVPEEDKSDDEEKSFGVDEANGSSKRFKVEDYLVAPTKDKYALSGNSASNPAKITLKPVIMISSGAPCRFRAEASLRYGLPRQPSSRFSPSLETFLSEHSHGEAHKIQRQPSASLDSPTSVASASIGEEESKGSEGPNADDDDGTFLLFDLEELDANFQRLFQDTEEDE